MINSRINALLHTACEIQVDSVEEQRYYEFSNALTEGDVLTLARMTCQGKQEETPVLFYMTTPVSLSMMDRLLGGEGDTKGYIDPEYNFTDVELRLYENIMQELIGPLGASWENYIDLSFTFDRVEVNPTLMQLIGLDETVVIVDIRMTFPNCEGRLSICLPGTQCSPICSPSSAGIKTAGGPAEKTIQRTFSTACGTLTWRSWLSSGARRCSFRTSIT